jgi:phosphoglycolate phosphatase-like HAD superfamily hydrolase
MKLVEGGVGLLLFDFDGTLTSVPGEKAARGQKKADLGRRARLLERYLEALQSAGVVLGIITKSQERTVRDALAGAGLQKYFAGPVIGNAIGFEGKAGLIEELIQAGGFPHLQQGEVGLGQVLLVDDDVRELHRARAKGIQTFPAPHAGGLQEDDLAEIITSLGLEHCLEDEASDSFVRSESVGSTRCSTITTSLGLEHCLEDEASDSVVRIDSVGSTRCSTIPDLQFDTSHTSGLTAPKGFGMLARGDFFC